MNVQQYENIKEKIKEAQTKKIQAETHIEQIEKQWQEDFENINNIEDATNELKKLEENIKNLEKKEQNLLEEIEKLIGDNE